MSTTNINKKILLLILDGLGSAPADKGNAVTLAEPQNLIKLWDTFPHTYLDASGPSVGLPEGVCGNSEVGHMNIGGGKIILQNLPKINRAIETGAFSANSTLNFIFQYAINRNSNVHVLSCFSDGGVHAHIDHLIAILKYSCERGLKNNLYFHCFTDGRDVGPKDAKKYFEKLQSKIDEYGCGKIASICGRAIAMDRANKWERTQKAYEMLTQGKGEVYKIWMDALNNAYMKGETDEFISPSVIKSGESIPIVKDGDVVLFANYRADRAIQLTETFVNPEFNKFPIQKFSTLLFVSMVPYKKDFPKYVLFPKDFIKLSLGRVLSENDKRQLRIAETEKFPHVTYFMNGGLPFKYDGEDRIEIPSPVVATYDTKPEMASLQILEVLKNRIKLNMYDLITLNLANADMVGHTGNLDACIKAVKVVDYVVGQLTSRFVSMGGTVIITADHGNAEEVLKPNSDIVDTEHSHNPVPLIIVDKTIQKRNMPYGKLCDIAPTILNLMNLQKPADMAGKNLLA